jgi:SAM-dependent methyltransferase
MIRKLGRAQVALVLLGVLVAGIWVQVTGGPEHFGNLLRVGPGYFALLLSITAFCIFVRFVRWQYLLRRVGVRLPERPSLSIFLASLAGTATPAYVGELIRCVFVRRKFDVPLRATVPVLVSERLLDVAALSAIAVLTVEPAWMRWLTAGLLVSVPLLGLAAANVATGLGVPADVLRRLQEPGTLLRAFGASLVAWVFTGLLISIAGAGFDVGVAPRASMGIFTTATLLGGITLMPAGIGTTGSVAIIELQRLGVPLAQAVLVVSLVRLATVGIAIAVSSVFLLVEIVRLRVPVVRDDVRHFDQIAGEYCQEIPAHVWDQLLERKIGLVAGVIDRRLGARPTGLDLGCGAGRQCLRLAQRGYRVVGIDAAQGLLRQAARDGATVAAGNALALPFRDASFDFVLTIGVLHHLGEAPAQEAACREVQRILKPGGLFIVHETNTRNPLFRFYMGYVFPILRSIDLGTEHWIEPDRWGHTAGMALVTVTHFTFLPDFVPRALAGVLRRLERWLENSRFRDYSVHYMATVRKLPALAQERDPATSEPSRRAAT